MFKRRFASCFCVVACVLLSVASVTPAYSSTLDEIRMPDLLIPPGEEAFAVANMNVMDGPDGTASGVLKAGDHVEILGYDRSGEWAETDSGWCFAGYLSRYKPAPFKISCDGFEAQRYLGYLNDQMMEIPENILERLADAGYSITVTTSDLGADNMYGDGTDCPESSGVTLLGDGICESYVEAEPYAIWYSAIHEVGHAFCWILGEPCMSEEFKYCFEEERVLADSPHHMENEQEYFASVFRDYVVYGEDAFADRSVTYQFIDGLVLENS